MRSEGLSHLAVAVGPGTLLAQFRSDVLSFYGEHFGWVELQEFARPDRMTIAIGGGDYLNLREVEGAIGPRSYEHFGLQMHDAAAVEDTWRAIDADPRAADLEPMQRGPGGFRQFRIRYLLPVAIEVQHVPDGRMEPPTTPPPNDRPVGRGTVQDQEVDQ